MYWLVIFERASHLQLRQIVAHIVECIASSLYTTSGHRRSTPAHSCDLEDVVDGINTQIRCCPIRLLGTPIWVLPSSRPRKSEAVGLPGSKFLHQVGPETQKFLFGIPTICIDRYSDR